VAETLAFMGIRDTASLLGPAARGAVRLLMQKALATPRRVFIRAGVAALVTGTGASTLLLQIERHPTSLLAPVTHDHFPASANTAAPAAIVQPVASHGSSTPISQFSTASAAARPAAAGESRATQASAPDTTSSIERATQDKRHQSLAPESEPRSAALGPDQIGALLRDRPVDGGSHLVRTAQIALAKLGYALKPNGAEDGATRRALRHFERAHGLAPTTEISPELVKQLMAAAGG
jgi:Putative peptidoglycan binding domain